MGRPKQYSDDERRNRHRLAQREYSKKFPERRQRTYRISNWKRAGIVCQDWDAMYDRYVNATECEACHKTFNISVHSSRKCLDHDHRTGQVRGVICEECNAVLRHYIDTDRLKLLMQYIES